MRFPHSWEPGMRNFSLSPHCAPPVALVDSAYELVSLLCPTSPLWFSIVVGEFAPFSYSVPMSVRFLGPLLGLCLTLAPVFFLSFFFLNSFYPPQKLEERTREFLPSLHPDSPAVSISFCSIISLTLSLSLAFSYLGITGHYDINICVCSASAPIKNTYVSHHHLASQS